MKKILFLLLVLPALNVYSNDVAYAGGERVDNRYGGYGNNNRSYNSSAYDNRVHGSDYRGQDYRAAYDRGYVQGAERDANVNVYGGYVNPTNPNVTNPDTGPYSSPYNYNQYNYPQ